MKSSHKRLREVEKTSDKCNKYMNYIVLWKVTNAADKRKTEQGKGDWDCRWSRKDSHTHPQLQSAQGSASAFYLELHSLLSLLPSSTQFVKRTQLSSILKVSERAKTSFNHT